MFTSLMIPFKTGWQWQRQSTDLRAAGLAIAHHAPGVQPRGVPLVTPAPHNARAIPCMGS
jgi:hypothetical protein